MTEDDHRYATFVSVEVALLPASDDAAAGAGVAGAGFALGFGLRMPRKKSAPSRR